MSLWSKTTKEREWSGVEIPWTSMEDCMDRVRAHMSLKDGFPFITDAEDSRMTLLYKKDRRFKLQVEKETARSARIAAFCPPSEEVAADVLKVFWHDAEATVGVVVQSAAAFSVRISPRQKTVEPSLTASP